MSRAVSGLRQIPFGVLIGAPLKASIQAQASAAKSTIEFIEKVGFLPDDLNQDMLFADEAQDADAGKVRNVTFTYKKIDENEEETEVQLTVPILTIVNVPFIRLDEVNIDFRAKLTDTIKHVTKTGFNLNSTLSGKYKSWWSPLSLEFRTSMSYETAQTTAARYTREYTMNINFRAVQDDMPTGLSRILNLLEQSITENPASSGGGGWNDENQSD